MNHLIKQITNAFFKFPQFWHSGPPTRLHVSTDIHNQLWNACKDQQRQLDSNVTFGTLYVRGCPVTEISNLQGFRWIRERPNHSDIGPACYSVSQT